MTARARRPPTPHRPVTPATPGTPATSTTSDVAVETRGASLMVPSGQVILADVDWTVRAGERWVVVGANGSGKTSLLRLAGAQSRPSLGTVDVLGERLGRTDMRRLRRRIGVASAAVADQLRPGLTAHEAVVSARNLLNNANAKVGPLVEDLQESSDEANKTMKETRAALVSLQQTLDPNSPLAVHLNQTLDSLTETSESLGEFTDYLQRNPGALIRGRYVPDKDK